MPHTISQVAAVVGVNLRNIPRRAGASAVAAIGIAGVVIVLVSILSIAQGFRATLVAAGDPRAAIVMRSGSRDEMSSTLLREQAQIVKHAPGVQQGSDGPLASAEFLAMVNVAKKSTGTDANVVLRGVEPETFVIRGVEPETFVIRGGVRIAEGRRFQSGRYEIVVGRAALRQFAGVDLGQSVRWGANTWTVVGVLEAGGGIAESEIWCDVGVLQSAFHRQAVFRSVRVTLESPDAFGRFRDALTSDPRLNVMVVREPDYFVEQSTATSQIITTVGIGIVVLMAIGAIFGALNTMYTAVAARTREIATLRALGFGALPVIISVLIESVGLALAGGVAGGLAAWAAFDGYQTSTLNWQSFSQVAFAFAVTPRVIVYGLVAALAMGLIGGLLPAVRAARLPIAAGLREL